MCSLPVMPSLIKRGSQGWDTDFIFHFSSTFPPCLFPHSPLIFRKSQLMEIKAPQSLQGREIWVSTSTLNPRFACAVLAAGCLSSVDSGFHLGRAGVRNFLVEHWIGFSNTFEPALSLCSIAQWFVEAKPWLWAAWNREVWPELSGWAAAGPAAGCWNPSLWAPAPRACRAGFLHWGGNGYLRVHPVPVVCCQLAAMMLWPHLGSLPAMLGEMEARSDSSAAFGACQVLLLQCWRWRRKRSSFWFIYDKIHCYGSVVLRFYCEEEMRIQVGVSCWLWLTEMDHKAYRWLRHAGKWSIANWLEFSVRWWTLTGTPAHPVSVLCLSESSPTDICFSHSPELIVLKRSPSSQFIKWNFGRKHLSLPRLLLITVSSACYAWREPGLGGCQGQKSIDCFAYLYYWVSGSCTVLCLCWGLAVCQWCSLQDRSAPACFWEDGSAFHSKMIL